MRKPSSPKIVVGPNDSMPDILTRLRTATGGPAALAIPATSSLLLTASEFRALKAAAEQARVELTVETDDRLRRQLATMFKIPVIDLLPGAVNTLADTPPTPAPAPPETVIPPPARPHHIMPEVPKLDLPPPVEAAPVWVPTATDDNAGEPEAEPLLPLPKARRGPRLPWKALVISLAALLTIVAIAAGAAYVLQTATVTLTVKRQQVSSELTYGVVSQGAAALAGAQFLVEAVPVTLRVPYSNTISVTGLLREPDQSATGSIALRNPTAKPIELAADSTFTDRNGVEYVVVKSVEVPAADDSTGPGRAEVEIRAAAGGEAANRDLGMLAGKMDNGLFYSNRDLAVTGGTDRTTAVVDQKDIDGLIALATTDIPALAIKSQLGDGQTVLPGTLQAGELTYTFDHQAGDAADTVTIEAEMNVTGMAFRPDDAATQATPQLQAGLTANTPAGLELDPATIAVSSPVLVNDSGTSGLYRITATASARTTVDDTQRAEISANIAGKSRGQVESYLTSLGYVDSFDITSSPGFLPERIPSAADKIEIETQ